MSNETTEIIKEGLKYIGFSGIVLLINWLGKKYNWLRQQPKEAADVKKVEQEIKSNSVTTAIEVTNLMLTRLTQAETRLTDVQDENDKLRVTIDTLREVLSDTKNKMRNLVNDLGECLKAQDCDEALKEIRKKYGLDN